MNRSHLPIRNGVMIAAMGLLTLSSIPSVYATSGPPAISTDSGSASFVAGDNTTSTPVVVDSGLTVTDGTSSTLASATVAITGNFHSGEDVLSFSNTSATAFGNIAASYNSTTGVLTMTSAGATATLAQWQAALDSVAYTDTVVTPNNATRTISFTFIDTGANTSNTATRTVTVTDTDQTPIVTTSGGVTSYVGGTAAVTVDSGVTVSDLDNTTMASATVSIGAGFHSGDTLGFVNTSATTFGNITASYNSATGVLTMTSAGATATDAQWANAFRAVQYATSSNVPGTRTIDFVVNDGTNNSAAATKTVMVATIPGAPTIGTAVAGHGSATISFTPPSSDGGSLITGYTVTANPGSATATGTSSPITVTGLTNGTAYTFTVTATNSLGTSAPSASSNSVTPTVPAIEVTPTTLSSAEDGLAYSQSLTASGGTAPYTWRITSGSLAPGMSLSSTGVLSGIPTATGTFPFTITATDSSTGTGAPFSASRTYTLLVMKLHAPDITTHSIGPGTSLGTTEVTASPNTLGDTFAYALGSSPELTPNVGDSLPHGATAYTSRSDITNVSASQYLDIFEVNGSNQIQAWHEYQIQSSDILSVPVITGISPSSGATTGGTLVTITGTGFTGATLVDFGSTPATRFTVVSDTSITATAPAGTTGVTDVTVTTPGGTSATGTAEQFTYLSSDANLLHLTLDQGTLSPVFASGTTSYTDNVPYSASSVNVTPTVADSAATLTVNGAAATSGSAVSVPLNVGSNTVSVVVTAQDGSTQETYTVAVTRATPAAPPVQSSQPTPPPFMGTNGYDTVLGLIWLGPNGTNWSAQAPDGTQILVQVPSGTLNQQDAVRLTSSTPNKLADLTSDLKNVTVLGGYGLNVANDTPNGPIEFWFQNASWVPGTMVYQVDKDGSLNWVPTETLSSGWLRFAVAPSDLAQGGNFVMVLPNAVKTLKVNEGLMEWNGAAEDMPTVPDPQGTYGPLFYVMQALKQGGVTSHWNGKAWTLTDSSNVAVQATTEQPASGETPVIVNGTTVAYVTALVAPDGWSHRPTTHVSISELDTVLKSLFGNQPNWTNGQN